MEEHHDHEENVLNRKSTLFCDVFGASQERKTHPQHRTAVLKWCHIKETKGEKTEALSKEIRVYLAVTKLSEEEHN